MPNGLTSLSQEKRGTGELALAMFIAGSVGVFALESGTSSFNVVFFRCLFGALTLALYCLARGFFRDTGLTTKRLALAVLGGVFIVLNWVFLFQSFTLTSIGLAAVVYHTQPFYVVLLGAVLFRERATKHTMGWIMLAFAGLVLVTGLSPSSFGNMHGEYWLGVGYALLAALLYAFATLTAKRLESVRPHIIALVNVLVGMPLLLPFTNLADVAGFGPHWGWLIGMGVLHTGVQYVLMYSSYHKLRISTIAILAFVYPIAAMGFDYLVYGHAFTALQILGVPLILFAGLGVKRSWRVLPTLSRVLPAYRSRSRTSFGDHHRPAGTAGPPSPGAGSRQADVTPEPAVPS